MEENNENSSNIKREQVTGLKNITFAGLFSRFVAFIVDAAIMAFVFFGLLLFVQNVVCPNSKYVKESKEQYYQYNVDSGLMKWNDEGSSIEYLTYDSYQGYEEMFYKYHTQYLASEDIPEADRNVFSGDNTPAYWFNTHVLGQADKRGIYTDLENVNILVKETGPELFTYQLDASNEPILDVIALPKCQNNDPSAAISEADQKSLIQYFYISDADNTESKTFYYSIALVDLSSKSFVVKAFNTWYKHFYTLPMVICFLVSVTIFFFIIPICTKDGVTLGKRMFHLCLANKLGYKYKRIQLLPRFLLSVAVIAAFYFILGVNIYFLGVVTLFALVSYGLAIFTKNHSALHDFVAGTIVVDKNHSEIYENATKEDDVRKEIEKVNPILGDDIPIAREENILYKNENYDKQIKEEQNDKKEG